MLRSIFYVLLSLAVLPSIALAQQTIDVYIIAGQSNADGRGEVSALSQTQQASLQNSTIISYLNPGSERERAEPESTPPDLDVGTNGFTALVPGGFSVDGTSARQLTPTFGPELSFGASIAQATGSNNQIAIIKVTRGGASLRNDYDANLNVNTEIDTPAGFLYRALLERVTASLAELEADGSTAIVRGFVWHQGESDSSTENVNAYTDLFVAFVEGVRAEFGEDIPFVLGELSRNRPNSTEFNNNLLTLVTSAPDLSFISSEGLTTPADDPTHFDANGQLELGRRFAAAFGDGEIDPLPEPPIVFNFRSTSGNGLAGVDPDGPNLDPSPAGDTVTVEGLSLTIVDMTFPQYELVDGTPQETGVTLSAADGDGGTTSIGGQDSLGLNNPSVNNDDFDLIGDGAEGNDFNPGETLTFTFDQAVQFASIELESVETEDSFNVLVDGQVVLETTGDDEFIDNLGGLAGLTIAAGSEITFAVDGVLETLTMGPATSLRIETFAVEIVPEPEPILLCDVNRDGAVNFLDISPFISVLSGGDFQAEADCNEDGSVNFLDISPFIVALAGP